MTDYLKGNTPATIYKQLLGVGAAADHAGLTASLKSVWTDDGAGGATASSIKISSSAMRVESNNQLRFRDDAIYIYSSGDTVLNLVADGEIDLATAAVDINATSTLALDNTNTSNGVAINTATSGSPVSIGHSTSETTVNDNLTVTGTTAHTGVVTMASGVKLQFVDGNEYLSGNSSDLTIGASGDINLTASTDVNIPANVGITFGDDGEKIEGDGTNLAVASSGALNLTGAAASTWKTTSGLINIDAEASTVEIDGHSGVNIVGNAAEVDITTTGAVDINSGAFTLDGAALSIDGTDDSNFTVTGSGKDVTVAAVGGGAQTAIFSSAGTGADAVQITSSAGGIDIAGASGGDIDITSTGKSVNITSTEGTADAIVLSATVGGIDITTAGTSGDEDIDISSSGSVNISSSENVANAIYLRANAGTDETIKIHADQGTADTSIYLLSDAGSITIDSGQTSSNKGVLINTATSGGKTYIGHSTSNVYVGQHLTVAGDLTVTGTTTTIDTTNSGTIARLTINNTDTENADKGRDSEVLFKGALGAGTAHELAAITVSHQGSSADMHGQMHFRLNDSTSGASLATTGGADDVLTLTYDKTATFGGAIAAGTNVITGGQVNSDNLRLDGNTISTTDSNGDLIVTPNGTGGVTMMNTNAPGDYAFAAGNGANADGNDSIALGTAARTSAADSVAIGDSNTAAGSQSVAIGSNSIANVSNGIAIGKYAYADVRSQLVYAGNRFSADGDSRCVMVHDLDTLTMSSSWQNIDSITGGIALPNDTIVCGKVMIVGSITGAGTTAGYIIDFVAKNDGGSYSVLDSKDQPVVYESDGNLDAQVAIDSSKLVAQVTVSSGTPSMRWSAFWQFVQQTF